MNAGATSDGRDQSAKLAFLIQVVKMDSVPNLGSVFALVISRECFATSKKRLLPRL